MPAKNLALFTGKVLVAVYRSRCVPYTNCHRFCFREMSLSVQSDPWANECMRWLSAKRDRHWIYKLCFSLFEGQCRAYEVCTASRFFFSWLNIIHVFLLQCFDSVGWAINPVKLFARRVMWHYTLPYHMMVHLPSACVPGLRFDVSPRLYTACSYTQLIGDTIYSGHTHPSWHESYPLPTGPSVCNHVLPLLAVCPQSKFWYIVMMYVICSTVKLTI